MERDPIPTETRPDPETRLGRPPLPRDRARSERIVSFVTPGEFDALKGLAEAKGESVSMAVHRILTSVLREEE